MTKPIHLYLIGGFLGAGKTTFLKSLLENLSDKKVGVLVNEFGSVGVDGTVIRRDGIEMVELSRGSIFCACLKQDFVQTLKQFSALPIDVLLIENSGMADPGGMQLILSQLAPYLTRPYDYRGLICLVDCLSFLDYVDVLMPLQNQIKASDFVLVNKTDLVSPAVVSEIHDAILDLNPVAELFDTVFATVPFSYLDTHLSRRGAVSDVATCSCNTVETRPANYVLEADTICTRERLEAFCTDLATYALRIKGFMQSKDGWIHVDSVGKHISVKPAPDDLELDLVRGKLVIIGQNNRQFDDEAERLWMHHCRDICNLVVN